MWSYSGDPSQNDLNMVRFLIGDTDASDPQLSNEEITSAITVKGTANAAAIFCANALAARYTRMVDKSLGDLSISYSQRAQAYRDLIVQLRVHASSASTTAAHSTGLYVSEKKANESDVDIVQPAFRRGMHDYESASAEEPE